MQVGDDHSEIVQRRWVTLVGGSLHSFLLRVIAGLNSGRVWVGQRRRIGWRDLGGDWGEGRRFSTKQKLTRPTKIKLRNLSLIQSRSDPLKFNQDQLEKIKFWDGGDRRWVRGRLALGEVDFLCWVR